MVSHFVLQAGKLIVWEYDNFILLDCEDGARGAFLGVFQRSDGASHLLPGRWAAEEGWGRGTCYFLALALEGAGGCLLLDLGGLLFATKRSILIVEGEIPLPKAVLAGGCKRVLTVLFVPSVERDGKTAINQRYWRDAALRMFGKVFGGATAYPKAEGIWRDDERGGVLVKDKPVIVHCYMEPESIENAENLAALGAFCRKMGRETNQGEVGLVIANEYFAIRKFTEE